LDVNRLPYTILTQIILNKKIIMTLQHFLTNSFAALTKRNYKLASILGKFTDSALSAGSAADTAIAVLYAYYHPLYLAFDTAYQNWKTQKDISQGGTETLVQLLGALPAEVNTWGLAILSYYGVKTNPTYKGIFPHGHTAFYSGTYMERIDAVGSLSTKLTGITPLAATKTAVDAYYTSLMTAYNTRQGQTSGNTTNSDTVEIQRLALCDALQYVLGGLIQRFYQDLGQIAGYIDINSMERHQQTQFINNHLKPLTENGICERTLGATDQIRIINNGSVPLKFYFANSATGAAGAIFITLAPGADETHNASDFGDVTTLHFLNVSNADAAVEGAYEVDLL
jgi:hypothetical protein